MSVEWSNNGCFSAQWGAMFTEVREGPDVSAVRRRNNAGQDRSAVCGFRGADKMQGRDFAVIKCNHAWYFIGFGALQSSEASKAGSRFPTSLHFLVVRFVLLPPGTRARHAPVPDRRKANLNAKANAGISRRLPTDSWNLYRLSPASSPAISAEILTVADHTCRRILRKSEVPTPISHQTK